MERRSEADRPGLDLDRFDGVKSHATGTGFSSRVAKSANGEFWFLPLDGP